MQAAAEHFHVAGWELTAPMSCTAVEPQKSSKQGPCPHLLELSTKFSLWKTTCDQSGMGWGGGKGFMKRKQVLGMLSPRVPPSCQLCLSVLSVQI